MCFVYTGDARQRRRALDDDEGFRHRVHRLIRRAGELIYNSYSRMGN